MNDILRLTPLELWGGVECTFNRVGDRYFNQFEWSGHDQRVEDLDLFADIGLRALRYPVIWESLAPETLDEIDWTFPDERLNRLRQLEIRPIAGLVHHGSGPRYANIASPDFAPGLAKFAREVARRYPWIDDYTPINEPLTTARFCGLYGHWHPHGTSNESFVRILLNECQATVQAMRAIREVNPQARLIQTEDMGRVYSLEKLGYQAHFENQRRWLSFDLLCGRIDRNHIMWDFLIESGASPRELDEFCESPCPPDVIGINHYLTSDRFLVDDVEKYPADIHASNGRHDYVDVEALRVMDEAPGGLKERLCETWHRYGLPLAVTEVHLGCSREEQVRWMAQAWSTAQELREEGVPIQAVTAWSLLGSWNWNSLVTRDANHYETGVFDLRGPKPRPTALVQLLTDLARGEEPHHPVLDQPGWWHRPQRMLGTPPTSCLLSPPSQTGRAMRARDKSSQPLLILGGSGILGKAFSRECDLRGLPYHSFARDDLDLCDSMAVELSIDEVRPWAVINATGYTRVQNAEIESDACHRVNCDAAKNLAEVCARHGIALTCFSSDLVFDGQKQSLYMESDSSNPLNQYGQSKAAMESGVLAVHPDALIVRTGVLYGSGDPRDLLVKTLRALRDGVAVTAPPDVVISPTYTPDLVTATLDLIVDGAGGLWHLANEGSITWQEFVQEAAGRAGIGSEITNAAWSGLPLGFATPRFSALGSERGQLLPSLDDAMNRCAYHR